MCWTFDSAVTISRIISQILIELLSEHSCASEIWFEISSNMSNHIQSKFEQLIMSFVQQKPI